MKPHPSHDWSDAGLCYACMCTPLALEARYQCVPSAAEPDPTQDPPVVDWMTTKDYAA